MPKIGKVAQVGSLVAFLGVLFLSVFLTIRSSAQGEWQSLTIRGSTALRAKQDKIAEGYFSQALKIAESEKEKPNEEELIASLQNLGICCERAGKYDDAARLYTRMAMITVSRYGEGSQEFHEALAVLKHCSLRSPLLQQCPNFSINERNYSKI